MDHFANRPNAECKSEVKTLADVPTMRLFRFLNDRPGVFIARGNNWYGSAVGYDGGPWYMEREYAQPIVEIFEFPALLPDSDDQRG